MKILKRKGVLITLLISLLVLGSVSTGLVGKTDYDFYASVGRNLKIFGQVYKQTANNYVEDIDPEKFMRAGINGMLDELDPYSTYLEREAQDDIEIMTRGKYYGVGMRITLRNGWPTVAEQPFPNSPAEKAGIREGDQIIEIDGKTTKGLSLSKTASKLRGEEKGSTVVIKIKRVSVEEPITYRLVRDEIIVSDIQYSGFVEPGVGLVKLNVFNRGAEKQVADAIEDLRDQGMQALILDLRGNPGGLLDVAVAVADNFLPKGELVVYTKGRNPKSTKEYHTTRPALIEDMPLAVLVNQFSASASEIVAGSIQDLDRGVVIGESTFGKGLVQTVLPINRSSEGEVSLKLTTAKYYLPSGRLIQNPEIFKKGRDSVLWAEDQESDEDSGTDADSASTDSTEHIFYTRNGRQVNGGGGVHPDIESDNPNTTRYVSQLLRKSMFFNFSLQYAADHPELAENFEITEEILAEFNAFVEEKEFDYEPAGMEELKELEEIAREEGFYEAMEPAFQQMRDNFTDVKAQEKQDSTNDVKYLLKRELTAKLYGNDAAYATSFDRDVTLKKAVEILQDQDDYGRILAVQTAVNN